MSILGWIGLGNSLAVAPSQSITESITSQRFWEDPQEKTPGSTRRLKSVKPSVSRTLTTETSHPHRKSIKKHNEPLEKRIDLSEFPSQFSAEKLNGFLFHDTTAPLRTGICNQWPKRSHIPSSSRNSWQLTWLRRMILQSPFPLTNSDDDLRLRPQFPHLTTGSQKPHLQRCCTDKGLPIYLISTEYFVLFYAFNKYYSLKPPNNLRRQMLFVFLFYQWQTEAQRVS